MELDRLHGALSSLDIGSWALVEYTTTTGKKRSVKGDYQGIADNIMIINNGRNNKVPLDNVIRITVKNG